MNEPLMMPAPVEELGHLISAILHFERFSARLTGDVGEIGEQWAAHHLDARLRKNKTREGWDLYSASLGRIQVRTRMPDITGGLPTRVDMNGDYDHLAFVYLDRHYRVQFLQLLTQEEAAALGGGNAHSSPKKVLSIGKRIIGHGLEWPSGSRGRQQDGS